VFRRMTGWSRGRAAVTAALGHLSASVSAAAGGTADFLARRRTGVARTWIARRTILALSRAAPIVTARRVSSRTVDNTARLGRETVRWDASPRCERLAPRQASGGTPTIRRTTPVTRATRPPRRATTCWMRVRRQSPGRSERSRPTESPPGFRRSSTRDRRAPRTGRVFAAPIACAFGRLVRPLRAVALARGPGDRLVHEPGIGGVAERATVVTRRDVAHPAAAVVAHVQRGETLGAREDVEVGRPPPPTRIARPRSRTERCRR